jgi:hypothetical protein
VARSFADVAEFVANVDLEDIYCLEERARLILWTDEQLEGRTLPENSNAMGISRGDNQFRFRFRTVFTDRTAEYVADWEAFFALPEPAEVSDELLREFAQRVGFFSVYPYIRASIYGCASRLNQPIPVLGIVRQGEFELGDIMSTEEAHEAFEDRTSERV